MRFRKPTALALSTACILLVGCSKATVDDETQSEHDPRVEAVMNDLNFGYTGASGDDSSGNCVDDCGDHLPMTLNICHAVGPNTATVALVEMVEDEGDMLGSGACDYEPKYASSRWHEYDIKVHAVAGGDDSLAGQTLSVVDMRFMLGMMGGGRNMSFRKGDLLMMGLRQSRGEWFNLNSMLVSDSPDELVERAVVPPEIADSVNLPATFAEFSVQVEEVLADFDARCGQYFTTPHSETDAEFEEFIFVPDGPQCGAMR